MSGQHAFFIDQNLPEILARGTLLWHCLGYGWLSLDRNNLVADVYEKHALGIADEVCRCLHEHGFEFAWDGTFARMIGISLNWQRRTLLR